MTANIIPDWYVNDICRLGQMEKTCAFLLISGEGWECAKDTAELYHMIQLRLAEGSMNAIADNCPGWGVVDKEQSE